MSKSRRRVSKRAKKAIINSTLLLIIFLFAQMLVPDFVALGLLFNMPHDQIVLIAVFGMMGAIGFMVWYNRRGGRNPDIP